MAATIVPIIAQLAPTIVSLITALVHKAAPVAETTNGPGTGPVKFAQVFQSVVTDLNTAANAGQISKTLPDDNTIQTIIQAVVTSMQLSGMLPASTTTTTSAVTSASSMVNVGKGQVVTVTGV